MKISILTSTLSTRTKIMYGVFALFMMVSYSNTSVAQGDLLVFPKRVIFEGNKRSEQLNLSNIGKDTATYTISFVQYRMKENGSFQQITTPDLGQFFSDNNLRFFPRTVTLGPNETQTVKVQLTKSDLLVPGEYRSHIYFRAIHKSKPLGEAETEKDTSISIKLVPIFGISIPTIIRVGDNNAAVSLTNTTFQVQKDTIPVVSTKFNRTGDMSVYGDITVDYISSDNREIKVGSAKGVAVYTPTPVRQFEVKLNKLAGVNYNSGKLRVRYTDQSAKPVTLAEDIIVLKAPERKAEATASN